MLRKQQGERESPRNSCKTCMISNRYRHSVKSKAAAREGLTIKIHSFLCHLSVRRSSNVSLDVVALS